LNKQGDLCLKWMRFSCPIRIVRHCVMQNFCYINSRLHDGWYPQFESHSGLKRSICSYCNSIIRHASDSAIWVTWTNYVPNFTIATTTTTTTVLRPFVWDYPGEPVPEETLTHPPSWSSPNLYQLLPHTTIHSILPVQTACSATFLHNLSPGPLWSTSWYGALHLIFHTFLHPISVFFSQHMPIP